MEESSSEDEEWGAPPRNGRSAVGPHGTPMSQITTAEFASVPFRTSLSPDFLRLFAPAGSSAPPTPPHMFNKRGEEDVTVMGLTDIPSPTDDLFGPFADKELFNKTFEDLCISDDDSEQSM